MNKLYLFAYIFFIYKIQETYANSNNKNYGYLILRNNWLRTYLYLQKANTSIEKIVYSTNKKMKNTYDKITNLYCKMYFDYENLSYEEKTILETIASLIL
jgi:hypothetical protein